LRRCCVGSEYDLIDHGDQPELHCQSKNNAKAPPEKEALSGTADDLRDAITNSYFCMKQ
jgi:hypothetical protein